MKLDHSLESLELESHNHEANSNTRRDEGLPDSPESPDESMSSDIFIVEEPSAGEESMTSDKVAEYLERVRQEDSSSYFNTPSGTPRRINFKPVSLLNDLEEKKATVTRLRKQAWSCPHWRLHHDSLAEVFSPEEWPCHSPLPVWVAAAKESGLEEGIAAICDYQNGISTTNLKTLNLNFEINCD